MRGPLQPQRCERENLPRYLRHHRNSRGRPLRGACFHLHDQLHADRQRRPAVHDGVPLMEPLFIGVLFVVLFYVVGVHVERRVRQKEENDREVQSGGEEPIDFGR